MGWNKHIKPPADFCPGKYCVMWVSPGGKADMSGRTYKTLAEAITVREGWKEFPQGGCACTFGICTRLDPKAGDHDWYEASEYDLKQDGLPWFYFIPSREKISPEFQEEYDRESRELWGDEQS